MRPLGNERLSFRACEDGEEPHMRNLNMRDQRFPPVENPAFGMTARWSIFEIIKCDFTGETQGQSATVRDRRCRKTALMI
jgi:hypothetical protein